MASNARGSSMSEGLTSADNERKTSQHALPQRPDAPRRGYRPSDLATTVYVAMSSLAVQILSSILSKNNADDKTDYTRDLPIEVLARVFKLVKGDGANDSWLVVACVSRHWRAIALFATELWTTLTFDHRYTPKDVVDFLSRSKNTPNLCLTFDLTRVESGDGRLKMLQTMFRSRVADPPLLRLRALTIRTKDDGYSTIDKFSPNLAGAKRLKSLTLEDTTGRLPRFGPTIHSVFRKVPKMPALEELRIGGLLVIVPSETLKRLKTLEITNTEKYSEFAREGNEVYKHIPRTLAWCDNLQRLVLRSALLSTFEWYPRCTAQLRDLRYIELLAPPGCVAIATAKLHIPQDAATHIVWTVHPTQYGSVFPNIHSRNASQSSDHRFRKTTALALHASEDQSMCGSADVHASGDPIWRLTRDMHLCGEHTRRATLRQSFRELAMVVNPLQLVHLELHVRSRLPTYEEDWKALLLACANVRVLRVGSEPAAMRMLAALPSLLDLKLGLRTRVLPRRLHELALCMDAFRGNMVDLIRDRVERVAVLRVCLPQEAHRNAERKRMARRNKRALRAAWAKLPLGARVRVEYGAPCEVCSAPGDMNVTGEEGLAVDVATGPGEELAHQAEEHNEARQDASWWPADDPNNWSTSSDDSELESDSKPLKAVIPAVPNAAAPILTSMPMDAKQIGANSGSEDRRVVRLGWAFELFESNDEWNASVDNDDGATSYEADSELSGAEGWD
ncbi:hypothetical protein C8Q77DRAFT_1255280 [Trametes polyzona]|nr:hypothetical protein C8Q77DRAFT_1255280 [Trametes polyzona]